MEGRRITAFIITGPPGVGKTTLVRKIVDKLHKSKQLQGFYTEEVRSGGVGPRIGFDVVTLDGTRGLLAREATSDNLSHPKVGKYKVYINEFEALVLPFLQKSATSQLTVIDEIGKMELFSKQFEKSVDALHQQRQPILATIPQQTRQPIPIVERLRSSPHARVYLVTKANRNQLINEILSDIQKFIV